MPPRKHVTIAQERAWNRQVVADLETTIATLTAENAALTQRVAELERDVRYVENGFNAVQQAGKQAETERDAAMAEAQRLWQSLADVLGAIQSHGTLSALPEQLRESAFDALAATAPAAASERRVAEQRVIEAARKARGFDKRSMLNHTMENYRDESEAIWAIYTEVDALAALDAPGGGA